MSIVRYRHWPRHAGYLHEINHVAERGLDAYLHSGAVNTWQPRVDIREEAERFVILVDMPGIDPAQIEVQMDKGVLSIHGRREVEAATEGVRITVEERRHGDFKRSFNLPDSADAEGIVAVGHHGVLEISIPKKAESTPRRIRVNPPTVQ